MKNSKTEKEPKKPGQTETNALFAATVNKMLRTPPKVHDGMKAGKHKIALPKSVRPNDQESAK